MAALKEVMHTISSQRISNQWLESNCDKSGGFLMRGQYAWFASGANIVLYSKQLRFIVSSRSFDSDHKDKSFKITSVKELYNNKETNNFLLVGCSFKSSGKLFVCQLPTLTTIRCIELPWPISYIDKIKNNPLIEDQFCNEFKMMSTILLVGMVTGAVYAIDLRQDDIEEELRQSGVIVNESRPNKLLLIKKNDCQEIKEMRNDTNCHLALFINEKFHTYCKKQFTNKLKLSVSCLIFIEEINTIAMGFSTGHFQLWDCKIKRTICSLEEPNCFMPITHISFLEPSDDPNNLCYLWVIQSDNSKLPSATMIGLNYKQRIMMPNGFSSYRMYAGNGIKLQVNLKKESGVGRCISALSMCNMNLFRDENDIDEDSEIRLFSMLIEICRNPNDDPECFVFVFDINQWYKAQMPSVISHLKVSNMYASFVKLPHNTKYLDFNISEKSLRPFGYNLRNNIIEELYYPSSMYFECDCLVNNEIIRFKHAGIQQEILDQLLLKSWKLLINPTLVFNQCLQTNLKPFFWDKPDDYVNYSLPDQRSFVISILVENKLMSVISACAEEWKNGTYISSEATILHLVQCLWKHVMAVKQYADKLCVPLFDYSGTQMDKKNQKILSFCLSQMQCVKNFLEYLSNAYGANIINVDYSYRVFTLNLVTEYFKAVICFLNYGLLPESHEKDPINHIIQCDFTSLIQYAVKRRTEFGNLKFYLIDAIVYNDPKGNKLIEQWQHEGCEITKGLYPPSNVQCLLRIYLNAALTDTVKNFITIYFLIDVCASLNLDIKVANRMCNFAIEFDVENKILNTLCRASWLFDHDMFEDAIKVLSSDNGWSKIESKSWNWFHWTVLKLLVFKKEYFWAKIYLKITKMEFVNVEEQKFYINLQIMNNKSFDVFNFIHARPINKHILYEYLFDRLKEINNLKCLIEYPFECDEEELFLNYLKRYKDMATITIKLLFLLQRGRYLEAIEQKKIFISINKSKCNDVLAITNLLVNGFDKCTPDIMKKKYVCPPVKNLYKKTDVILKNVNSDNRIFNIIEEKKDSVKMSEPNIELFNPINLIIPLNDDKKKRSPTFDIVPILKRRKMDDITCLPKAIDDTPKPIVRKQELEILNTPLVAKSISQTLVKNISSILKTNSAKKDNQSIKFDTIGSKTTLRFSLPSNNNTQPIEQINPEETMETSKIDNQRIYRNDLVNKSITQSLGSNKILEENCKIKTDPVLITKGKKIDQCKSMEICTNLGTSGIFHPNSNNCKIINNSLNNTKMILVSLSDGEGENIKNNTKLIPKTSTCSNSNANLSGTERLTSNKKTCDKPLDVSGNTNETYRQHSKNTVFKNDNVQSNKQENVSNKSKSYIENIPVISLDSDTESYCSDSVKRNASGSYSSGELSEDQSIYSDEESVDDEQSIYSDEEQSTCSEEQIDDEQNNSSDVQVIDDESVDNDQNTDSDVQPIDDESVDNDQNTDSDVQPIDDESVDNDQNTDSDAQSIDDESVDDDQSTDSDLQILDDEVSIDNNLIIDSDMQPIDDKEPVDNAQNVDSDVQLIDDEESVDNDQNIDSDVQPIDDKEPVDNAQDVDSDVQLIDDEESVDNDQNIDSDVQLIDDKESVDNAQNVDSDVQLIDDEESVDNDQNTDSDVQPIDDKEPMDNTQNVNSDVELVDEEQEMSSEVHSEDEEQDISSDEHSVDYSQSDESDLEITRSGRFKYQNNVEDVDLEEETDAVEEERYDVYSNNVDNIVNNNSCSNGLDISLIENSTIDSDWNNEIEENILNQQNEKMNDPIDEDILNQQNAYEKIKDSDNISEHVNLSENPPTNVYGNDTKHNYSMALNLSTSGNSYSCEFDHVKESDHDSNSINDMEIYDVVENENMVDSNPNYQENSKEAVEHVICSQNENIDSNPNNQDISKETVGYVIGSQNAVQNENIIDSNLNNHTNLKEVEYVVDSQNVVEHENMVVSNPNYQDNSKETVEHVICSQNENIDSNPNNQDISKETVGYVIGSQNAVQNENIIDSNLNNHTNLKEVEYVVDSQNVVEHENMVVSNPNYQDNSKETVEHVICSQNENIDSNPNNQDISKETVGYVIGSQNAVQNENIIDSNLNNHTNLKEVEYVVDSQNVVEHENMVDSNSKETVEHVIGSQNENIIDSNSNDHTNLKEVEYVMNSQNVVEHENMVDSNPNYQDNSKKPVEYVIGTQNLIENKNIVDSNPSNSDKKETVEYVHETNSGNILNNKDKTYNTEVKPVNNERNIHTDANDFDMPNYESNSVSSNDSKNLTISKMEVSQPENVEINQPTPFLFGKAFFGQQEKLENKPLLFGQLYNSEKEQIVDLHNDELGIQNVISVKNHKEDILHNKVLEEKEVIDEMQDILELESLPESNPEENTDVPLISNTNESNPQSHEQSPVLLGTYELAKKLVSEVEMKSQQPLLQDETKIKNPQIDPSSLQKFDIEQIFAKKSSTRQSERIIITRSRAKSVSSKLEGNTNLFRLFDGDNSKQVRVSLNKNKSKSQENISTTKRKREKSKSPIDDLITSQNTVFGLEKIPEEGSYSNADKIIETKPNKKSKFNFLKHTSKVVKHDNCINVQEDTKVKTPKKSKSVYSEPAATMSVVKTNRSKRSSSINLVISDDESVTENEGYMEVLQKALGPNRKKSFRAASVPNRKKPKMIVQKPSFDDSRPDLNDISITSEDSFTSHISPIEGNNSKHMLITPAKYQTKVPMKSLESKTDDSSSDESTNSKCLTRSMIVKETIIPAFTPDRRVTRSQTLNLDNSLQSTSLIGHDQTEKGLKSGTKKTIKRKNSIN